MRAVLHCAGCGQALTGSLTIWSTKDPASPPVPEDYGKPLSVRGEAYKSHEAIIPEGADGHPLRFKPQYWLNSEDVADAVKNVRDPGLLNGCCGPSGYSGPNQRCRACGATVGTLVADCWTPHVVIPEPDLTTWEKE